MATLAGAGSVAAQEPAKPVQQQGQNSKEPEHWIPKLRLGDDNAYFEFYGQINKGLLIYDDGGQTENYFPVDNGNSSSRAGFRIYSLMENDWSFGANLEWEWNPTRQPM